MLEEIEPSPDWKGAERVALAMEAKAGSRNEVSSDPGKRVKIASLQFLPASFLSKTCRVFAQRNDAPSMALLVCDLG